MQHQASSIHNKEHLERDALAAAAMAFAPATEVPRDRAVMRSALVSLVADFVDSNFTRVQAVDSIRRHGELVELRDEYVYEIFDKLVEQKAILPLETEESYEVSESVKKVLERTSSDLNSLFDKVVARLFSDSAISQYGALKSSLLRCLARLMKDYGRQYAYQVAGRADSNFSPGKGYLLGLCRELVDEECDFTKMADAIAQLYENNDPTFARFSFFLAQNYYYLNLLGLSGGLTYFSQERFRGAEMFLDTNLLVNFLLVDSRHHRSVLELYELAQQLRISFHISEGTLDELRGFVASQMLLSKTYDEVPEGMVSEIRKSGFFHAYRSQKSRDPQLTIEEFFSALDDPRGRLSAEWGIEVLDKHFDLKSDLEFFERAKREIQAASKFFRRKEKPEKALEHDAHLLQLVRSERADFGSRSAWLLTLDASLIPVSRELRDANEPPWCMALDGFLQILSPYVRADKQQDFAENFLRVIGRNLFVPDDVLEIDDFRMFTDIDLSVRQLPPSDVRKVIHKVRDAVGDVQMSDRKKIAYEVQKALSDPTLSYKVTHEQKIAGLEDAVVESEKQRIALERKAAEVAEAHNKQLLLEREIHQREMSARRAEADAAKAQLEHELQLTKISLSSKEEETRRLAEQASERGEQLEKERQRRRQLLIHVGITTGAVLALLLIWTAMFARLAVVHPSWAIPGALTFFVSALLLGMYLKWTSHARLALAVSGVGVVAGLAKLLPSPPAYSASSPAPKSGIVAPGTGP